MFSPQKIADALQTIDISEKQREDLRRLYLAENGLPYHRDAGGRIRGETVYTCSRVGSALHRYLDITRGDGMMMVGSFDEENALWRMSGNFRAALEILGWFQPLKSK